MHDPTSMTEVIEQVNEVIVIDLLEHAVSLEDYLQNGLEEPQEGIYLTGSVEPVLKSSSKYYVKTHYPNNEGFLPNLIEEIKNNTKIHTLSGNPITLDDEIVDEKGIFVTRYRDLLTKKQFLKSTPTVPAMAVKAAVAVVDNYLSSISRKTNRAKTYHLHKLVKTEHVSLVNNDEYMHGFERLLDQVMAFIGTDTWNIYYTKIKGTSLIIEKSLDWRIYSYYENLFKQENEGE